MDTETQKNPDLIADIEAVNKAIKKVFGNMSDLTYDSSGVWSAIDVNSSSDLFAYFAIFHLKQRMPCKFCSIDREKTSYLI